MSLAQNWQKEYNQKGIPSSFRTAPSGALVDFLSYLKKETPPSTQPENLLALDLGHGRGRNSIHLAKSGYQVESIEIVPSLVEDLNNFAKQENLPIHSTNQSITDKLPYPDNYFDIAIDTFVYKHQTNKQAQANYRKELHRVLKPTAHYLLSLSADDDGYYGPLLKTSKDSKNKLITDPATKVESYLYTKEELEKEFSDLFKIKSFTHKKKEGTMHGKTYLRSTLIFIMQKN